MIAVLAAAGLMVAAPAAWAHANLLSSNPAAGATLQAAPAQVVMNFTEEPDLTLSFAHVLNTAGAEVESGPVQAGANPKQLVIPLPANLANGSYTVTWRTTSAEDGHTTAGAFAFGVGQAPSAPTATVVAASATPSPSVLSVLGKFDLYLGLSLAAGAVATALFAFGGYVPSRRRLLPIAGVLTLVGVVMMLVAERSTIAVGLSTLLRSRPGHAYVWLLIGAAVTCAASLVAARTATTRTLIVLGIAVAATMGTRVQGGHAAAQGWAWFQILVQWMHFLAVGVWVGGFVPVLLLLRERRAGGRDDELTAEVRRYSTMAGISLAVVIVTGVIRAVTALGGMGAVGRIFDTSYGTVLALKVGLAVVLIGLGTVNRYRSIPRLEGGDPSLLRRVMRMEVVAGLVLFALTGTLTGLAPNPPAAQAAPAPASVSATGSDFATTMKLTLTTTPGTAGPNTFDLAVVDYDTGVTLSDVTGANLTFTLPARPDIGQSTLGLKRSGDGSWAAPGSNLSVAGTWRVVTLVQQGGHATTVILNLTTALPQETITQTAPEPGQPTIYTLLLPDGRQIQAYNDPGTAGPNQLHVTAFGTDGKELPLKSIALSATPQGGSPRTLDATRFSAGHFVASEVLTNGAWHFDIQATARDGSVLDAYFDQTIGAA
jgi:copper transport protein